MKTFKKSFLYLSLFAVLSGCANASTDHDLIVTNKTNQVIKTRNIEDAVTIANSIFNANLSASRSNAQISANDIVVIYSKSNSRNNDSDTLMYAVNMPDNGGFVLVSAPENVTPIIGFSDFGRFDSNEVQENESFQYALSQATDYVSSQASGFIERDSITLFEPFDTITVSNITGPRVWLNWDQHWPGNLYCSNGYTGCGPLALAMVCSYFESPTSIELTYNDKDVNSVNLDWTEIKKHTGINLFGTDDPSTDPTHYNSCTTEENHKNLARFIRQIGQLGNASYDTSSTSMNSSMLLPTLKTLLPNKSRTLYQSDMASLASYIKNYDGVAYVIGQDSSDNGHFWIADGLLQINYQIRELSMTIEGTVVTTTRSIDENYIHFNWGWGGHCNGYFLQDVFDTSKAYKYDNSYLTNSRGPNFTKNIYYLFVYNQQ